MRLYFLLILSYFLITTFTSKDVSAQNITKLTSIEFYNDVYNDILSRNYVIIDGRTDSMHKAERIENSINIDADHPELEALLSEHLHKDVLVIYCTTFRRSSKILATLEKIYSGEIICISDGIRGWKENGLSTIQGNEIKNSCKSESDNN